MRLYDFIDKSKIKLKTTKHPSNSYVLHPGFKELYVRYTKRKLENHSRECLDIGRVIATKPGKGAFTLLVMDLKKDYPDLPVYVESVINKRFCDKLKRMGFCPMPNAEPPSFYLLPSYEESL